MDNVTGYIGWITSYMINIELLWGGRKRPVEVNRDNKIELYPNHLNPKYVGIVFLQNVNGHPQDYVVSFQKVTGWTLLP
jgi:hypothetical protein